MNKFIDDQLIRKYKNELVTYHNLSKIKSTTNKSEQPPKPVTIPPTTGIAPISEKTDSTKPSSEKTGSTKSSGEETTPSNMTVEERFADYVREHPKKGELRIQTLTARRTYPVPGATVEILKVFPEGNYLIGKYQTDNVGYTPKIVVPTAEAVLSLTPDTKQPYSTFDAIITHPSFTEVRIHSIPVFENIVSMQVVDMMPKSATPDGKQYIEYTAGKLEGIQQ